MNRSRILIADDHNLVAELCRNLLAHDFDVVGTVGNGRAMERLRDDRESPRDPHGSQ